MICHQKKIISQITIQLFTCNNPHDYRMNIELKNNGQITHVLDDSFNKIMKSVLNEFNMADVVTALNSGQFDYIDLPDKISLKINVNGFFHTTSISKLEFDSADSSNVMVTPKSKQPLILPNIVDEINNLPPLPTLNDNSLPPIVSTGSKSEKKSKRKRSRKKSKRKKNNDRSRSRSRSRKKSVSAKKYESLKEKYEAVTSLAADEFEKRKKYQLEIAQLRGANRALTQKVDELTSAKNEAEKNLQDNYYPQYMDLLIETIALRREKYTGLWYYSD